MPSAARDHGSFWHMGVLAVLAGVLTVLPLLVTGALSLLLSLILGYWGVLVSDWGPAPEPDVFAGRLILAALGFGTGGVVMFRSIPFAVVLGSALGALALRGAPKRRIILGCTLSGPLSWVLAAAWAFPESWLSHAQPWLPVTSAVTYWLLTAPLLAFPGALAAVLLCRVADRLRVPSPTTEGVA